MHTIVLWSGNLSYVEATWEMLERFMVWNKKKLNV